MRPFVLSIFATFIATPSIAEEFSIDRSYTYYQQDLLTKDAACIAAFREVIVPNFRGLNGIELSANSIVDTTFGALATYTDVNFRSVYGDSVGSISCAFAADLSTVTDVGVSFTGAGLGGFERRGQTSPSSDPADWKVTSFSSQILQ
ncbi:hypothetical protein [Cochlodiniinecator piscidefendens]|uniref:hypothetical protein n=1 Tax=Cochlodiniinecator piscidefendens TaxID=2715756 RepID=UPI00140E38EF|nr:hypothetical protein [Cochlodiniinecator piscidefendens]